MNFNTGLMSPCKNCTSRYIGCHNKGACSDYDNFKDRVKKRSTAEYEEKRQGRYGDYRRKQ